MEVLVVTVVLGVLAAIALPAFTGQRGRALDAEAMSIARAGAGALEAARVETGDYSSVRAELLDRAPELDEATAWSLETTSTGYRLSVTAGSGNVFAIARSASSPAVRTCTTGGTGGCPAGESW